MTQAEKTQAEMTQVEMRVKTAQNSKQQWKKRRTQTDKKCSGGNESKDGAELEAVAEEEKDASK